ncbi:MAG: sigma-70 family RNA polymerase sigma factor, partial [Clostridia bacterium]|nr:sigma-70 family RNA polymerase sigma factor [Clostridia bacterium]
EASENVSEEEGLEEKILDSERKKKISKAIEGLPEQMRLVIHLAYFEDMSYKEIAMVMKIKPKQVDNLLYRAKKELRERLLEDGELF